MRLPLIVACLEALGVPQANGIAADVVLWGLLALLLKLALSAQHPQSPTVTPPQKAAAKSRWKTARAAARAAVALASGAGVQVQQSGLSLEGLEPEPELAEPDDASGGLVHVSELPLSEQVVATMLLHLASDGVTGKIKSLLDESKPRLDVVHPSSVGVSETVLHLLARRGNSSAIALLLEYGAPVGALDSNNATALDVAAKAGHTAAARALLEGTDISVEERLRGKQGSLNMAPSVGWRLDGAGWIAGACAVDVSHAALRLRWEPTAGQSDQSVTVESAEALVTSAKSCTVFGLTAQVQFEVHTADERCGNALFFVLIFPCCVFRASLGKMSVFSSETSQNKMRRVYCAEFCDSGRRARRSAMNGST
jgi:hypothetical protein